jgi:hypothetical protein
MVARFRDVIVLRGLLSGAGYASRMRMGRPGQLIATELPTLESIDKLDIAFSQDRQLFVMYSWFLKGASLWDFHGLWSSQEGSVDLVAFRNHTS